MASRFAKYGLGSVIWGDRTLGAPDCSGPDVSIDPNDGCCYDSDGIRLTCPGGAPGGSGAQSPTETFPAAASSPAAPPDSGFSLSQWLSQSSAKGWPSNGSLLAMVAGGTALFSVLSNRGRRRR